jgi:hypothetical protein
MMVDVGLMRSFATAVAADAQALVIDHDNKGHGWILSQRRSRPGAPLPSGCRMTS